MVVCSEQLNTTSTVDVFIMRLCIRNTINLAATIILFKLLMMFNKGMILVGYNRLNFNLFLFDKVFYRGK
jgi:hypothetical protein